MKKYFNNLKSKQGYTLLFALLFASVVLAVSLSILLISRKELILSSTAKDSQEAFYAADSAAECAVYWDLHNDDLGDNRNRPGTGQRFSTSSAGLATPVIYGVRCNNTIVYPTAVAPSTPGGKWKFTFEYNLPNSTMAHVDVFKEYKPVTTGGVTVDQRVTTIEARGYNTTASTPQKIERGIRVTY